MATVRRSGQVAVVDWAFDASAPGPLLDGDIYIARLKLLVEGDASYGAILVRLLLLVGDLPGNVGVSLVGDVQGYPIGKDYVRGQAFPLAAA